MDFEKVWEFVQDKAFIDNHNDPVLIPDYEDWEKTKSAILNARSNSDEKKQNKTLKKFGELTASLPVTIDAIGVEKFDEELMEENILMPKKEYLKEIYDENIGLDKWIQK